MRKYDSFDLDIQNTKIEGNDVIIDRGTNVMCDYSVNRACSEAHICFESLEEDK